MIKEFKAFILRGNVVELAVAVIIGAAFTLVVNSLVKDVFSPIIGLIGGQDFSTLTATLKDASGTDPAVVIRYGNFINALINFLLVALAVFFFIVKPLNTIAARRKRGAEEPAPEEKSDEVILLEEIRDLLKEPPARRRA